MKIVTMRARLAFSFGVLALLVLHAVAGEQTRFVTTRGKELVDPGGAPLFLRGINLGNWLVPEGYMFSFDSATSPRLINQVITELVGPEEARRFWHAFRDVYITRDDIHTIRQLGLNSVRVPFTWRLFLADEGPDVWLSDGFEMLDRVIGWCEEEGLWVVLDMHCAPGGQTGDNIDDSWGYPFLFESPAAQERTRTLWREIAKRYADRPTVIGYDLLNEPIAPFYDTARFNPLLEPLYRRIVEAIREVDRNHLIFLGGAQWNTNFKMFGPPFDDKMVYTFHKYWCDTTQSQVQEYLDFRDRYNVPIWMGESGENTDQWVSGFRKLQERNNIGWCFWPYKKMNSPRCLVTFDRPEGWAIIEEYANGTRAGFASIRTSRPPIDTARKILGKFLEAARFERTRLNDGFIYALGCSPVRRTPTDG
jgi:endoglucanase